jgi:transposase InsO family protein
MSKQSFYQMLTRRKHKYEEQEQLIPLIEEIRKDHPRMSARDIYFKLKPVCMGRDQFEKFCMGSGYRLKQLRNYRVTTNSLGVTRFPNLIKDLKVTRVNQVFVSDITYYDMGNKTYYLTFIMDLFNREIVGWSESEDLKTENTTIPALHILIKERGRINLEGAILHSDGGGQYYSNDFKALTKGLKMINSMTEEKVYENSHAERLNGIIKNNYLYPYNPTNRKSLQELLKRAIVMYNTDKPHSSLGKMTPVEFRENVGNVDNFTSYLPFPTLKEYKLSTDKSKKESTLIRH